jgi:hypothetical protein
MDEFANQEKPAADRADRGIREAETWKQKVEHVMWKHAGTTRLRRVTATTSRARPRRSASRARSYCPP